MQYVIGMLIALVMIQLLCADGASSQLTVTPELRHVTTGRILSVSMSVTTFNVLTNVTTILESVKV